MAILRLEHVKRSHGESFAVIVIGDVHGCLKTLQSLISLLPKDDEIVFVGDLIDRGPSCVDTLKFVRDRGYKVVRGNHEDLMLWWFRGHKAADLAFASTGKPTQTISGHYGRSSRLWQMNGGNEDQPWDDDIIDWVTTWPVYFEFPEVVDDTGRILFVSHAAPYNSIHKSTVDVPGMTASELDRSVLWYRGDPPRDDKRFFVFGHTPRPVPDIDRGFAMIDTGCVYRSRSAKFKYLTAFQYPSRQVWQVENIDI